MQAVLMATHGKNWTEFPLLALVPPVAGIWGVKQGTDRKADSQNKTKTSQTIIKIQMMKMLFVQGTL